MLENQNTPSANLKYDINKLHEDAKVAEVAIALIKNGDIEMLLPKMYWHSHEQKVIKLTDGFIQGDMGAKIIKKYNLISLVVIISVFYFSTYKWYLDVVALIAIQIFLNKFRSQSLSECVRSIALQNPYGFINVWNEGLIVLKSKNDGKIYMKNFDDWRELVEIEAKKYIQNSDL